MNHHKIRIAVIGLLLTVFLGFCPGYSGAEEIEFASSPNPVGSGARALGMGGAFIAVADDATAASWNPAGLIQLETPEVSVVGTWFSRSEDNDFGYQPQASGIQRVDESSLNYFSAAYPFTLFNHNMIVSLNYQELYDFTRDWNFLFIHEGGYYAEHQIDYTQEGGLSALGLAYAVQITPKISVGITCNIWDDDLLPSNWTQKLKYEGPGNLFGVIPTYETYYKKDDYSFSGTNFNIGFLWNVTGKITIGGVFKTPFEADVDHDIKLNNHIINVNTGGDMWVVDTRESHKESLDMPMSYGLGIAYRHSDQLTLSLDLYRTHWDDMIYEDYQGVKTSAISGIEESKSGIDPTIQAHFGVEYLLIKPKYVIPLRAGLFYDPAPAEKGKDEYYGFTLGTGCSRKRFAFDIAYQFRYGSNVGADIYKGGDLSQDVEEHNIYTSLIVYF